MERGANLNNEYEEELRVRKQKLASEAARGAIIDTYGFVDPKGGWELQGLCGQTDPDSFYPTKGMTAREQKKVCGNCEVRLQCLEAALAREPSDDHGIWGGTTKDERQTIRNQRKQAS